MPKAKSRPRKTVARSARKPSADVGKPTRIPLPPERAKLHKAAPDASDAITSGVFIPKADLIRETGVRIGLSREEAEIVCRLPGDVANAVWWQFLRWFAEGDVADLADPVQNAVLQLLKASQFRAGQNDVQRGAVASRTSGERERVFSVIENLADAGITTNELTRRTQWVKDGRTRTRYLSELESEGRILKVEVRPTVGRPKSVWKAAEYCRHMTKGNGSDETVLS